MHGPRQPRPIPKYLVTRQKDVANAAAVKIDQSYTLALNSFSATLTVKQLAALSSNKKVASLAPDELKHVTATPSTSFLGLGGTGGIWDKIGGLDKAGNGIVLGDLDTGIAPENPSFAGLVEPDEALRGHLLTAPSTGVYCCTPLRRLY